MLGVESLGFHGVSELTVCTPLPRIPVCLDGYLKIRPECPTNPKP